MSAQKPPLEWLRTTGAQRDVIDGLARFTDWGELYDECPRGDWLLGIVERLGVEHVALVRAAVACARIADADEDAKRVLDLAEQWTNGQATTDAVTAAVRKLEAAPSVDPAREAASRAALAAGLGVTDRAVLTTAPAAVAESIMIASIDCGYELAMRWAHDTCATAVRAAVPWSAVSACLDR